jgi:hypothetical protein
MNTEKILEPTPGIGAAGVIVLLALIAIVCGSIGGAAVGGTFICFLIAMFILPGFVVVNPN